MNKIISIVISNINQNTIFIFPSEIICDYWKRKISYLEQAKTIASNRFISWDRFKKDIFRYIPGKAPVTIGQRIMFILSLLDENREKNLFQSIIDTNYRAFSGLFVNSILKLLPVLNQLIENTSKFDSLKKNDLMIIYHRYLDFLEQNNLFESNYLTPTILPGAKRYIIFFPEVLEDYSHYREILNSTNYISFVSADTFSSTHDQTLSIFENSLHEIKWLFRTIKDLLQNGTLPEEIVITACNLSEIESYLKNQAAIYGIPIEVRRGKTVLSFLSAKTFKSMRDCHEQEYSLLSLKSLISNRSLPWKHLNTAQRLLRFGIDFKCLRNNEKEGIDKWETSFKKAKYNRSYNIEEIDELVKFYRLLSKSINKICRSDKFERLKENLNEFIATFFERESWDIEQFGIIQFALSSLNELCVYEKSLTQIKISDPFRVWLEYLGKIIYVRKSKQRAIPVYPYRVSAGICVNHHFIINTSQDGMKYIIGDVPFVGEYESSGTGKQDLSKTFFSLYSVSGENVYMSFSKKSFSQTNIIPSFFITHGKTESHAGQASFEEKDLLDAEEAFWLNKTTELPAFLSSIQKRGFSNAVKNVLLEKQSNYTISRIDKNHLESAILPVIEKDGYLKLSATQLERYISCPFRFLLQRVFGLDTIEQEIELFDAREFGKIFHRIFQSFYLSIAESHGGILSADPLSMETLIIAAADAVIREYEKYSPLPIEPVWDEWKELFHDLSLVFIGKECGEYGGYSFVSAEDAMTVNMEKEKIALEGKIDRILEQNGKLSIVDYKKKNCPTRPAIFSENAVSYQIPFYLYLAENILNKKTGRAGYYLIESGQYYCILDDRKDPPETDGKRAIDPVIGRMTDTIIDVAGKIREGAFPVLNKAGEAECGSCIFRGVCRTRYILDFV
jgi:RecB family exonuclease